MLKNWWKGLAKTLKKLPSCMGSCASEDWLGLRRHRIQLVKTHRVCGRWARVQRNVRLRPEQKIFKYVLNISLYLAVSKYTASSTLDESKQLLAQRRMMPAILCTQLPAVLMPDLQPVQCESRSCSNPSPIHRGLRAGSLSLANKYDTVWKLASLRDDFQ